MCVNPHMFWPYRKLIKLSKLFLASPVTVTRLYQNVKGLFLFQQKENSVWPTNSCDSLLFGQRRVTPALYVQDSMVAWSHPNGGPGQRGPSGLRRAGARTLSTSAAKRRAAQEANVRSPLPPPSPCDDDDLAAGRDAWSDFLALRNPTTRIFIHLHKNIFIFRQHI